MSDCMRSFDRDGIIIPHPQKLKIKFLSFDLVYFLLYGFLLMLKFSELFQKILVKTKYLVRFRP